MLRAHEDDARAVWLPQADGERLHEWVFDSAYGREMTGQSATTRGGIDDDMLRRGDEGIGATIMGRNMFGPIRGGWGDATWDGWWGPDPPFHHPVFVLTHHARPPVAMAGGTTFHFVTDGIERALDRAKAAADGRDVRLGGGAQVVNQYLAAGLLDELELHIAPVLLGSGARLFDGVGPDVRLERVRVVEAPGMTHVKYRVTR